MGTGGIPSRQHLNKMLFSSAGLFALSETAEDAVLAEEGLASGALDFHHFGLLNVLAGRDGVEVEVFAEDDDAGPVLEHVAGVAGHRLDGDGGAALGRVGGGEGRGVGVVLCWDCGGDVAEEVEHVREGGGVVLRGEEDVR